ncbi:hypothetical protein FRC14_005693 [Serendipita sp. 396]|nr:hypothetical protein FRC14_005693 [Serendipita sp. 396]
MPAIKRLWESVPTVRFPIYLSDPKTRLGVGIDGGSPLLGNIRPIHRSPPGTGRVSPSLSSAGPLLIGTFKESKEKWTRSTIPIHQKTM